MTKEEIDEVVDRISRNVYNIVESFGWYYLEVGQDDIGGTYTKPTYEEAIKD